MLQDTTFSVVAIGETIAAALTGVGAVHSAQILICGWRDTDSIEEFLSEVGKAQALVVGLRTVVLADVVNMTLLCQASDCKVDAVLSKNISEDVLRGVLNLVLLGQRLFPAPAMQVDARNPLAEPPMTASLTVRAPDRAFDSGGHIPVLSEREDQILRFLSSGKRNKLIAHDLGISEATVKFHIRALMRKLGVANRTQAAIVGMSRGRAGETALLQTLVGSGGIALERGSAVGGVGLQGAPLRG